MKNRCENIGVCADFGNIFYAGEKPEDFIATYIDDIKHVHIKDYHFKTFNKSPDCPGDGWGKAKYGWAQNSVVGEGIVDMEKCLKLLKAAGYDGIYSLEICHKEPLDYGIDTATRHLTEIYGRI